MTDAGFSAVLGLWIFGGLAFLGSVMPLPAALIV
jgi:hypothetical protein